jgi:hypothetical protein
MHSCLLGFLIDTDYSNASPGVPNSKWIDPSDGSYIHPRPDIRNSWLLFEPGARFVWRMDQAVVFRITARSMRQ